MNEERLPSPTFGEWLDEQLKQRKWSRPRLSRIIDYSPATIEAWVNGRRNPKESACDAIADAFGVDRNEVRRLAGRPDEILPVPEVAGTKEPLTDWDSPWEYLDQRLQRIELRLGENLPRLNVIGRVPADGVRWAAIGDEYDVEVRRESVEGAHAPFGLEVTGDCFRSVGIYAGDIVICDPPEGRTPRDRQIVVVRVGDGVTLKRWCVTDSGIELRDGDERIVHTLEPGSDFEVQAFYLDFIPRAPR